MQRKKGKQSILRGFFGPLSSDECRTCTTPPVIQEGISGWISSNEHVHVDALREAPYVKDRSPQNFMDVSSTKVLAEDGFLSNGMTIKRSIKKMKE